MDADLWKCHLTESLDHLDGSAQAANAGPFVAYPKETVLLASFSFRLPGIYQISLDLPTPNGTVIPDGARWGENQLSEHFVHDDPS